MKKRITITIDKKLLKWIDEQIKTKRFASRSHAFEYLVAKNLSSLKNRKRK